MQKTTSCQRWTWTCTSTCKKILKISHVHLWQDVVCDGLACEKTVHSFLYLGGGTSYPAHFILCQSSHYNKYTSSLSIKFYYIVFFNTTECFVTQI